mgnify:CR=1 FL=1
MGGKKRQGIATEAKDLADKQFKDFQAQSKAQKTILDKQKQEYKDIKFTNPYESMQNQFAENVYEDMTVNQQQAQFQAQQGAQQRANIMQGLRGSAGGSGIASLAQSMANQGQLQTQQISASIGAQEAQNQLMRGKGQLQVQSGASAVDLQKRAGDAAVQQAESAKTGTLLGMEYGAMAGINEGKQAAMANQMSAIQLEAEMKSSKTQANASMWGGVVGSLLGAGGGAAAAAITKCLLPDMIVKLSSGEKITVAKLNEEDVIYGDDKQTNIEHIIKQHLRESYYLINNELKITGDHPVWVNGDWKLVENLEIDDKINNVKIKDLMYIEGQVDTVYIKTTNGVIDVYSNDNVYKVSGDYDLPQNLDVEFKKID